MHRLAVLKRSLIIGLIFSLALGPAAITYATDLMTARLAQGEPSLFLAALRAVDRYFCPVVYALDNDHATTHVTVERLRPPEGISNSPVSEESKNGAASKVTNPKQYGAFGNNGVNRGDPLGLDGGATAVAVGVAIATGGGGTTAAATGTGVSAATYAGIVGGGASGASTTALGGAIVSVGAATGIGIVGGTLVVGGFAAYQTLSGLAYGTQEGNAQQVIALQNQKLIDDRLTLQQIQASAGKTAWEQNYERLYPGQPLTSAQRAAINDAISQGASDWDAIQQARAAFSSASSGATSSGGAGVTDVTPGSTPDIGVVKVGGADEGVAVGQRGATTPCGTKIGAHADVSRIGLGLKDSSDEVRAGIDVRNGQADTVWPKSSAGDVPPEARAEIERVLRESGMWGPRTRWAW